MTVVRLKASRPHVAGSGTTARTPSSSVKLYVVPPFVPVHVFTVSKANPKPPMETESNFPV